jgi:hypothetical protein
MKGLILIIACCLLAGCSSWRPDERVVGHFVSAEGAVIDITSDGRIFYGHEGKNEYVGFVTVTRDTPLTIFVVAPDSSQFTGTVIVFSANRQILTVEWRDVLRQRARSTQFEKR